MHDRQHYTLIGWRHGVCGYRRFFSITSLAGLRQEDRAVFDATHVEVKRWFDEGLVDGVRIDHPDGLADPAGYLTWLREITGPQAWIVIEKILAVDEPLDLSLPVAGTTGYDALREIGGLFVDPAGERTADRPGRLHRRSTTTRCRDWPAAEGRRGHRHPAQRAGPAVPRHRRRHRPRRTRSCRDAVAALLSHIGVYRSDYLSLAAVLPIALAETAVARPELAEPLAVVSAAVGAGGEAAVRLQQLCGAATAKSMEDCLFYRDAAAGVAQRGRRRTRPLRGERRRVPPAGRRPRRAVAARDDDVVAPTTPNAARTCGPGSACCHRCRRCGRSSSARGSDALPPPDPTTGLFLWQNVFGVWPVDGAVTDDLRARLHAYAEKAIREAASHTTWNDPDAAFEDGRARLARRRHRRTGRRGADRDWWPGSTRTPAATAWARS